MQGVLVVPGRRGLGHIRLGQDYPADSTIGEDAGPPNRDIPSATPVGGFGLGTRSDEDLKRLYIFAQTSISVRAKSAFLSQLSVILAGDPTMMGFYRSTPQGQAFVDALAAARGFFLAITQPNIMTSLQNLVTDLEVNHLVKRGYSISGRSPIFTNGRSQLSYADTKVNVPANIQSVGSIDFGDLSKTNVYDDVNSLRLIASSMDVQGMPSLGVEPVTTGIIILAIIKYVIFPLIIAIGLYATVKAFSERSVTVELPPGFEKLSPEVQKMILEGKNVLEGLKDTLKWLAAALGIVVVGGTTFYFLTKD